MQVVVPGDEVRTELDFHRILARQLEFGEYYGWNLAALRDRPRVCAPSATSRAALLCRALLKEYMNPVVDLHCLLR